jgi:hypothetical protein
MTTKKTPMKTGNITKPLSVDTMKELVLKCANETFGLESALIKYGQKYQGNVSLSKEDQQKATEELTNLSFAFGVENGHIVSSCVNEAFQKLAVKMKREIESEFDCRTYSEKALVDLAVTAYTRNMHYTWKMNANQEYLGQKYDSYRNYLSHEIDRSHRHYISAIETLKAMKQLSFSVNIKTQNAFVAQNQQLNNHSEQNNETK